MNSRFIKNQIKSLEEELIKAKKEDIKRIEKKFSEKLFNITQQGNLTQRDCLIFVRNILEEMED